MAPVATTTCAMTHVDPHPHNVGSTTVGRASTGVVVAAVAAVGTMTTMARPAAAAAEAMIAWTGAGRGTSTTTEGPAPQCALHHPHPSGTRAHRQF